jgi:pyruvate ferredoxin oxidoreductase gamma subunit
LVLLQIRMQGRGGQGAQVAGEVLARAFFRSGRFVQAFSTYGGARRGIPVSTSIRVGDSPIVLRCDIERPDAVVCFDETLIGPAFLAGVSSRTAVLINSSRAPEAFDLGLPLVCTVDGLAIARRAGLGPIVNSAVLGAFARVLGEPDLELLAGVISEFSPAKQEENVASAREAYQSVRGQGPGMPGSAGVLGADGGGARRSAS